MGARDLIKDSLIVDATRSVTTKAMGILHRLNAAGYVILSPDEVRGIRDEALEEAAKRAHECFGDPQAEADPDYVPAAIRALKGGRDDR